MRRFFMLCLITLLCGNIYSQNLHERELIDSLMITGQKLSDEMVEVLAYSTFIKWNSIQTKADELKGTEGGTIYYTTFKRRNYICHFLYKSNPKDKIHITLENALFDVKIHNMGGYWIDVLVGFYENGELVKKVDTGFWANKNMKNIWVMDPLLNKKIRKYLEDNNLPANRYIRLITSLFGESDLDIKVYPRTKYNTY